MAAVFTAVVKLRIDAWTPPPYYGYTIGGQTLLLTVYGGKFLHHLLPLRDATVWVENLLLTALCAAAAAQFSHAQRRGHFSIAPLLALALTILSFSSPWAPAPPCRCAWSPRWHWASRYVNSRKERRTMTQKRTSALRRTLERILPPNVPADTMHGIIVGSLAIGALAAAIDFTARYSTAYRSLFGWNGWLSDTALMNSFSAYAEPVVIVFGVVVLLALLSAVMLYSSYYLGGRSIYLMRRLPDGRQTLRRQVWTAPLLWAVSTVVLCALVLGLCYGAWYCITPSQCLPTEENIQRVSDAMAALSHSHYYG